MARKKTGKPRRKQTNMTLGDPAIDAIDAIGARLGIRHRAETVRFLVHEKARALGIVIPSERENETTPTPPIARDNHAGRRR